MIQNWFLIALFPPFLWSLLILIDDNLISKVYKNPTIAVIVAGYSAILTFLFIPFVKITLPSVNIIFWPILSGIFIIVSYYLYFKSLTLELPSIVSSLWTMAQALIPILSFIFLKETLSKTQFLGFLIILIASIIISSINIKIRKRKISRAFYL